MWVKSKEVVVQLMIALTVDMQWANFSCYPSQKIEQACKEMHRYLLMIYGKIKALQAKICKAVNKIIKMCRKVLIVPSYLEFMLLMGCHASILIYSYFNIAIIETSRYSKFFLFAIYISEQLDYTSKICESLISTCSNTYWQMCL